MTMNKLLHIVLLMLVGVECGFAQTDTARCISPSKTTTSIFSLDAGMGSQRDTYISPITYDGMHLRLAYHNMCQNEKSSITRVLEGGIDYQLTENPAGNHIMHTLLADFRWAAMHRWRNVPLSRLDVMVGPLAHFRGGLLYNPNNSNNVVSARIYAAVGVNAMASYLTSLKNRRLKLCYEVSLPMVGAMFSPEYDEAYYEIYVGNHSGLAHFAWWGNRFDITNYVFADYSIGANTVLRVGYRNRIESSNVCHIHTRAISHALVLGIGCNLLTK